jgi:alkylation response protein AidB-like acyl-CoA dehydrogenase
VGVTVDLELSEVLARYVADPQTKSSQREAVLRWNMRNRAFQLTQARMGQEVRDGKTPGAATSMFKLYGASLAQDKQSLTAELMGCAGIGWEGEGFSEEEIGATRSWLASRAVTSYGGTNEVQANIIAKRVLGLPD